MKDIRSIDRLLDKFQNRLCNLWQVENKYPVKSLEFKKQARSEILDIVLSWLPDELDERDYDGHFGKNWENVKINKIIQQMKERIEGER